MIDPPVTLLVKEEEAHTHIISFETNNTMVPAVLPTKISSIRTLYGKETDDF